MTRCLTLSLLFLALSVPAHAQTNDTHIRELLAQVEALKAQLALFEDGAFVGFTMDLTIGSSGREVTELQQFLIREGYAIPAGATGYFGEQTRSALASFQAGNAITPSLGYFGPLTRGHINAVIQQEAPPPPVEEEDEEEAAVVDIETSATTTVVDGADNDYATFTIELSLEAFGSDIFISQNGDTAFTYRFEDASTGQTITGATSQTATISSSANTSSSYYRVDEGDEETFLVTVTYDPLPEDEGASVRLQLLTLEYDTSAAPPSSTWNARPESRYKTPATYIND